jgi:hypothetical protein
VFAAKGGSSFDFPPIGVYYPTNRIGNWVGKLPNCQKPYRCYVQAQVFGSVAHFTQSGQQEVFAMSRFSCAVGLAVSFSLLILPSIVLASHFNRYPDDQESPINPNRANVAEGIPNYERGIDFNAPTSGDEKPGMLGYAMHGGGGLTIEYIYTGDVFSNMRGGMNTRNATEYLGLFDLAITADLDELGFFPAERSLCSSRMTTARESAAIMLVISRA